MALINWVLGIWHAFFGNYIANRGYNIATHHSIKLAIQQAVWWGGVTINNLKPNIKRKHTYFNIKPLNTLVAVTLWPFNIAINIGKYGYFNINITLTMFNMWVNYNNNVWLSYYKQWVNRPVFKGITVSWGTYSSWVNHKQTLRHKLYIYRSLPGNWFSC